MSEPTPVEFYLAAAKRYLSLPQDPEDYVAAFTELQNE
jgi:hypothetical protein